MAIRGCLLGTSAGLSGQNLTSATILTWDTERYDPDGCHSGSGSKIIIPSAYNGLRGIFTGVLCTANVTASSNSIYSRLLKNGSFAYTGAAGVTRNANGGNGQSTTSHWAQFTTGPLSLSTADEWEMDARISTDTSVDVTTASSFGLYVFGNSGTTIRCLAQLNARQTGQDFSSPAVVSFDGTDIYDTHSIHDPSGSPTKLIVPSAADGKYGVFYANFEATSTTDDVGASIGIRRTRSATPSLTYTGFGGNSGLNPSFSQVWLSTQTQVHQLTAGDEYEALVYLNDSSVVVEKTHGNSGTPPITTFGMWVYDK